MPRRPNAYYRPKALEEALQLLQQPDTVPLAGGTSLLATEEGLAAAVVDLQALGLNRIEWSADGKALEIGATTRLTDLAEWLDGQKDVGGPSELLRHTIRLAGPNTYRNAATFGGVCAARLPDSELLAALLALDATLTLRAPDEASMSLETYLGADERPAGLITSLTVPWTKGQGRNERVARTPADYPIVAVVCWRPASGGARLAATGIAARPVRLRAAESALAGGVNDTTVRAAAGAAGNAAVHPGDFRGDAAYRAEMVAVLTRRALGA